MPDIKMQLILLFTYAIPIACISWTITHEEVFREPREYCVRRSKDCTTLFARKFFYLFTCEYCFSHYVTLFMLLITGFRMVFDDWRGFLIAGFAQVWIANIYMSLFIFLRITIKHERTDIDKISSELEK